LSQRYEIGAKRATAKGAALALTLVCGFPHPAGAQNADPAGAAPLRLGGTQTVTQRAADRVSFVFELETRGDYLLRIAQGGLDLVVTLAAPGGGSESFNSPLLRNEGELVLLANRPAAPPLLHRPRLTERRSVATQRQSYETTMRSSCA